MAGSLKIGVVLGIYGRWVFGWIWRGRYRCACYLSESVRYQSKRCWYLNQKRVADAGAFGGSRCIQRYMLLVTESSGKAATEIAGGEDRERRRRRRTRSRRRRKRRKLAIAIAAAASQCPGSGCYFWEEKYFGPAHYLGLSQEGSHDARDLRKNLSDR